MPRYVDHAAREIAVAEAAWDVLLTKGIQGLSVRTVAAEAGLAVGSLRRSFPTQHSLLRFCIQLVTQRAAERIRALPPSDALTYAEAALLQTLPLDRQRRVEMEVWLALSIGSLTDPALSAECAASDAALGALCRRLIQGLHDAQLLRPGTDLATEGRRLHAVVDGLALHLIRQSHDDDPSWAVDVLRGHLRSLTR